MKKRNINEFITAEKVRLVVDNDSKGKIVTIKEALDYAQSLGLDLVEIAPDADPPVCKVLDYDKHRYTVQKKMQLAKKKQKPVIVKELKFTPKIEEHDYQYKVRQLFDFIAKKHKVKVSLYFVGRAITHPEMGMKVMERIINETQEVAKIDQAPRATEDGRSLIMVLSSKN